MPRGRCRSTGSRSFPRFSPGTCAAQPRLVNRHIPVDLETICLKACQEDPTARYQTAGEMADDLRRYLDRYAIRAKRVGPLGRLVRLVRRRKVPVVLFALLLVFAAASGLLGWQTWRARTQPRHLIADRSFSEAELFYSKGQYRDPSAPWRPASTGNPAASPPACSRPAFCSRRSDPTPHGRFSTR
jgi:hypothetical protein